jgi:ligand-binding sensor domain-containing protein
MKKVLSLIIIFVLGSLNTQAQWEQQGPYLGIVRSILAQDEYLFAGTETEGIYFSTNNGDNWVNIGLKDVHINAFEIDDRYVYAGTNGRGIYRSSNNGGNWEEISKGLPNKFIQLLMIEGEYLYTGTETGLYRSSKSRKKLGRNK